MPCADGCPPWPITADTSTPIVDAADEIIALDFADERSVVQTRFATSTLALLRASLGQDMLPVAADAERALTIRVDDLVRTHTGQLPGHGLDDGSRIRGGAQDA